MVRSLPPAARVYVLLVIAAGILLAGVACAEADDWVTITVLAALNIADELYRIRDASRARDSHLAERTSELEELLDRALAS